MSDGEFKPSFFQRYLHRNYRIYSGLKLFLHRRLTSAARLTIGGLVVAACLGVDTQRAIAYQGFAFLVVLSLAAMIGVWFVRLRFAVDRRLPRFGSVGCPMPYVARVRNLTAKPQRSLALLEQPADPRPSLIDFVKTPEPGEEKRNWFDRTYAFYRWQWLIRWNERGKVEERPIPTMAPGGEVDVRMELKPLRRGVMKFDGMAVACPEPLGLLRRIFRIEHPQKVLILPRRYFVPTLALPGHRKFQQGGVALASSVGQSEEFVSLRDYRPGDPLRWIHWRSWAKTGKPIVKEFQDEFFVRHALILDTFQEAVFSDQFEEAVSVAASFACTIDTRESLLDLLFVGPQAYCMTAGRGVGHVEQMLEILAAVQPCRDRSLDALERLVTEHAGLVSGCILVLLRWDAGRRRLIGRLQALDVPVKVFLIQEPGAPGIPEDELGSVDPAAFHRLEVGRVQEGLSQLN